MTDDIAGFPLGDPSRLRRSEGIDPFPPRSEEPRRPIEMDTHGYRLGRAGEMAARDDLAALIALTKGKIGEAQDVLATVNAGLEEAEQRAGGLGPILDAALGIATAAVGAGKDAPESAGLMVGSLRAAQDKATGGESILAALAILRYRLGEALAALKGAGEAAEEYGRAPW